MGNDLYNPSCGEADCKGTWAFRNIVVAVCLLASGLAPPVFAQDIKWSASFPAIVEDGESFADVDELIRNISRSSAVFSVAFSPGETHLASGGHDGSVRVWDVATGKETLRLEGHSERVG